MNRLTLAVLPLLCLHALHAQDLLGAGRARHPEGFTFDLHVGAGGMRDVEGRVEERLDSGLFPGGLNLDLNELGVEDDTSAFFWGARATNRWVTFLFDYRTSTVKGSGTTQRDIRLNIDGIEFQGRTLDYLMIPVNVDYTIDATTTWMGLGVRVTPFHFNPQGRLAFTPWVHLGLQYIEFEYDVDAGAVAGVETDGRTGRVYARQGQAKSREKAGTPEYGIGGELNFRLHPPGESGARIVADATWKMLDFQGAISRLGMDGDDFKDIDFTYEALELNLYAVVPLNDRLHLTAGIYAERVDISYVLEGDQRLDGLDRSVGLRYTLYGVKVGLRF